MTGRLSKLALNAELGSSPKGLLSLAEEKVELTGLFYKNF